MKRIFSLLFALALLASLCVSVFADDGPLWDRSGQLTILMDRNGEALDDGSLSVYRVAAIAGTEGNYRFEWVDALKDRSLSLEDLEDTELALALLDLTAELTRITAPIRGGQAVFLELEPALYLVAQHPEDAASGTSPIGPFLISVPNYQDGVYRFDVVADPKVPPVTEPTEPDEPTEPTTPGPTDPTTPDDPKLPQTGQLNWPVPVMAVSGMVLFVLGWMLRFGRKKDMYEE